ncbi:SDR family oxidoreductase [Novosphingobium sp. PS1R-30]|uniref:SDR family oxidoreductase n=1 Tax=Novosphingobium anseongense TaxID=3133436 RepID=A0ABU8RRV4_9SPHN
MAEFQRAEGVAIVTGAAGGMGSHCARLLGEAGWSEIILCDLDEARLGAVAEDLRAKGVTVDLLGGQITDPAFTSQLLDKVGARAIGAVIHTAGVSPAIFGDKDKLLEINLDATQAIVDAIRPRMAQGGAAVLFASMASYFPISSEADAAFEAPLPAGGSAELRHLVPNEGAAYTLSKRAVRAIAKREAKAFGDRGARIMSLSPGLIDTPMMAGEKNPQTEAMLSGAALTRLGRPEELAAAAVFLTSPQAGFITGCDLRVDGGALSSLGI